MAGKRRTNFFTLKEEDEILQRAEVSATRMTAQDVLNGSGSGVPGGELAGGGLNSISNPLALRSALSQSPIGSRDRAQGNNRIAIAPGKNAKVSKTAEALGAINAGFANNNPLNSQMGNEFKSRALRTMMKRMMDPSLKGGNFMHQMFPEFAPQGSGFAAAPEGIPQNVNSPLTGARDAFPLQDFQGGVEGLGGQGQGPLVTNTDPLLGPTSGAETTAVSGNTPGLMASNDPGTISSALGLAPEAGAASAAGAATAATTAGTAAGATAASTVAPAAAQAAVQGGAAGGVAGTGGASAAGGGAAAAGPFALIALAVMKGRQNRKNNVAEKEKQLGRPLTDEELANLGATRDFLNSRF